MERGVASEAGATGQDVAEGKQPDAMRKELENEGIVKRNNSMDNGEVDVVQGRLKKDRNAPNGGAPEGVAVHRPAAAREEDRGSRERNAEVWCRQRHRLKAGGLYTRSTSATPDFEKRWIIIEPRRQEITFAIRVTPMAMRDARPGPLNPFTFETSSPSHIMHSLIGV